jgi:3-hydroxyisobutyrate dehydrogenase-like beta-hydroxyacid dehydrogenase
VRVGFIGVGQMGRPMAERVLGAGFPLTIYARRPAVIEALSGLGAWIAGSPAEVAGAVDVLCVCTFSDAQLRDAMLGDGRALGAMRPGSVLVNHVTGNPALGAELAATAPEGVRYLDAPMSGTAAQIRAGQLTLLIGGDAEDLDRVRPVLASYADPIVSVGKIGDAQRVKLVNNLLLTVHLRLAGEAAQIGEALGIDPAELAAAIGQCSGASRAMSMLTTLQFEALREGARPFLVKDVAVIEEVAADQGIYLGLLGRLAAWLDETPP